MAAPMVPVQRRTIPGFAPRMKQPERSCRLRQSGDAHAHRPGV